MGKINPNGLLRFVPLIIFVAGLIWAAAVVQRDVTRLNGIVDAKEIRIKQLETDAIEVRKDNQYIREKVDAILLQMTSLSSMMQTTAINHETTKLKIEMIQEDMQAMKTQVTEALRTQ